MAELVRHAASLAPGSVVADRHAALALPDVVRRAEEVAGEVRRLGGRPDPVVAVALPASVDAVTHLLAAVLGDYTVVFLDPTNHSRTASVASAVGPDLLVDGAGMHRAAHPRVHGMAVAGASGSIAMSSGSTGTAPKGVLTGWDCLADFAPHGAVALALDSDACWAEPTHPSYDMAFTNWVLALSAGASLHVTSALTDRLRPLSLAARTAATHVRLAPTCIDLAAAEAARGAPCAVRVWGSGGDRLSPARASTVLGLGALLVNTYGTSETGGFASSAAYECVEDLRSVQGSVSVGEGRVGPWRLEVTTEGVGEVSHSVLAVRSPSSARGYAFGASGQDYPRWEPGRVVTGDLGVHVDGQFHCLGRLGRLVKRNAGFVSLDSLDALVREARGLASYTVATPQGELVMLVEAQRDALDDLHFELGAKVAPAELPDAIVPISALPRLGNGKADQAGAVLLAERIMAQGRPR